jgi:hypothetical protein
MGRIDLRRNLEDFNFFRDEMLFAGENLLAMDPGVIRERTAEVCMTVRVAIASIRDINVTILRK